MAGAEAARLIELDANFVIELVRGRVTQNRQLHAWMRRGWFVQASAVAWSEFLCGPLDADDARDARIFVRRIEPFIELDAAFSADLFNRSGRRSRSHVDCMIAAHAILRGAWLATSNLLDFRRFEPFGLRIASASD